MFSQYTLRTTEIKPLQLQERAPLSQQGRIDDVNEGRHFSGYCANCDCKQELNVLHYCDYILDCSVT